MKALLDQKITALKRTAEELAYANPEALDLKALAANLMQSVDEILIALDQITIDRALAIFEETPQ
jgi:biotin-(acetyl-CoA carboxylase) ligase